MTGIADIEAPRDFTFIAPRKRRLTEYEAVSVHQQLEPGGFDRGGWYTLTAEGRPAWRAESTRLRHPNWFAFRDPAAQWNRTYIRMQAEQERALERISEDAAGLLPKIDPVWLREIVGGHYRVWSFFEYGLFRAFSPAQREALSDPLGNALCFEAFDHLRHAQDIVLHMIALEAHVPGFREEDAKARWLADPVYQPARRLVEELIGFEDWAELAVVVNLIVTPILFPVAVSGMVLEFGPRHNDPVTPMLALGAERDRRRNGAYAEELVRMVTAPDVSEAEENRRVIQSWIDHWTPRVEEAAEAMAPIYERPPVTVTSFTQVYGNALAEQAALRAALGFAPAGESR